MDGDNSKIKDTLTPPPSATTPPPELEKEKTKEDQKNNENDKNQSCVKIYGIQVPYSSPDSESDSNSVNDTVPPPTKRSRCKTSIRSKSPPFTKKSKIYQSFSDPKYFDVILVSSDQIEIPTYRCVLAAFSTKFSKQFEKLRIHPARIQVKDFDASTIKDAIDFMFDRLVSVFGKEVSLLKFAAAYGIQDLMEKCCEFIENLGETYLSISNADLCQYIEIAYAHNLHGLKEKCLKLLAQKNKEIDVSMLKKLSKDIIIDIMRY